MSFGGTRRLFRHILILRRHLSSRSCRCYHCPGGFSEGDYITLNVPSGAFSNVPLRIWSLSVRQSYYFFSKYMITNQTH